MECKFHIEEILIPQKSKEHFLYQTLLSKITGKKIKLFMPPISSNLVGKENVIY